MRVGVLNNIIVELKTRSKAKRSNLFYAPTW